MKIIVEANKTILKLLARFQKQAEKNRLLHYVVEEQIDDGILLHNLLTMELVLLSEEEYKDVGGQHRDTQKVPRELLYGGQWKRGYNNANGLYRFV